MYVGHDANFAAHGLAKLAALSDLDRTWLGEILDCISDIIRGEQSPLSI
jgi:hypothetical protein